MIFTDFAKAVAQLSDSRFQRVLFLGIGLALGLLVLIYMALVGLISWADPSSVSLPIVGQVGWLNGFFSIGSLILMMVLSVFLMVPVASAMTSLFLDDVAQAVEHKHYPHLPDVPGPSFWDGVVDTVNFLGVLIAANIIAFALSIVFPIFAVPIFVGLNGFLLGREYFTLAAMRREGRQGAKILRKRYSAQIWFARCLMTVPLMVPILNLLIPILGAATFTHLYHRLAAR